jgi:hypothetical protein
MYFFLNTPSLAAAVEKGGCQSKHTWLQFPGTTFKLLHHPSHWLVIHSMMALIKYK